MLGRSAGADSLELLAGELSVHVPKLRSTAYLRCEPRTLESSFMARDSSSRFSMRRHRRALAFG